MIYIKNSLIIIKPIINQYSFLNEKIDYIFCFLPYTNMIEFLC